MPEKDEPKIGTVCPVGAKGVLGPPGANDPKPPGKRRGRPRVVEEPSGPVSVYLPAATHDRIIGLSRAQRQTVSEYLREVLVLLFSRH